VLCAGVERMIIPEGGAHVRAAEIRVPLTFRGRPTVTGTCHARSGPGTTGATFVIFNIKVNALGAETQIVIQSTNTKSGQPVQGDFDCDYVVVGQAA
jgi:hypothetical protein